MTVIHATENKKKTKTVLMNIDQIDFDYVRTAKISVLLKKCTTLL